MKKTLLFSLCLLTFQTLFAQDNINAFQLSGGLSWHGTGDLVGLLFDVSYDHHFTERVDLSNGLTTTINWGKDNGANGSGFGTTAQENLLRYTTAGLQLTSMIHFAPLVFRHSRIKVGGGILFRFQSTSHPNTFGFHQEPDRFPTPFYTFSNTSPSNTFSLGYTLAATYLLRVSNHYETGIRVGFQNDTRGDVITYVSLIVSRLLPKLSAQ